MVEAMDAPFALAARAQGIPRRRLLFRHMLPAALNPLVSLFGLSLGGLLSASLLMEVLMGWPGLGPLFLEAIMARDFALVLGVVMLAAAFLIAGNLLADLLLYRVDPADSREAIDDAPDPHRVRLAGPACTPPSCWPAGSPRTITRSSIANTPSLRPPGSTSAASARFVCGRSPVAAGSRRGDYREDRAHIYPVRFFTGGRLFGVDCPGVSSSWGSDG